VADDVSAMSDVDASQDPEAHIRYLEAQAELVRERRLDSYRMLDLQRGHRFIDVGCGAGGCAIAGNRSPP
jgi:hypothetical protein